MENPCTVSINGTYKIFDKNEEENKVSISLHTWPSLSSQNTIEIPPDCVLTIVEPINSLKKMYETQVLGIKEDETNQSIAFDEQPNSDKSD